MVGWGIDEVEDRECHYKECCVKVPLEWTTEQATTNDPSNTAILGGVVVLGRRLKLINPLARHHQ